MDASIWNSQTVLCIRFKALVCCRLSLVLLGKHNTILDIVQRTLHSHESMAKTLFDNACFQFFMTLSSLRDCAFELSWKRKVIKALIKFDNSRMSYLDTLHGVFFHELK